MSAKAKGLALLTIIGLFIVAFAAHILSLLIPMSLNFLKDILPHMALLGLELALSIGIAILLFTLLNRYLLKGILDPILKAPNRFSVQIFVMWTVFTIAMLAVIAITFKIIGTLELQAMGQTTLLIGLANAFLMGLQPGVIEELAYRWFFYGSVKKKFGKLAAVIATGLGFTLIHINQVANVPDAILLLLAAFSVSYLFILIYEITGTIWAGAVVHTIWDMFTQGSGISLLNTIERKEGTNLHVYDLVAGHANNAISGGSFGVESSLVTTAVFVLAIIILQTAFKKKA